MCPSQCSAGFYVHQTTALSEAQGAGLGAGVPGPEHPSDGRVGCARQRHRPPSLHRSSLSQALLRALLPMLLKGLFLDCHP